MKKTKIIKISAILLTCLLIFTSLIPQGFSQKTKLSTDQNQISMIPTWIVGTKWTYDLEDIDIELEFLNKNDTTLRLIGSIDELVLIVEDETDTYYELSFKTRINGKIIYNSLDEPSRVKLTARTSWMNNPKLNGKLILNKEDMSLIDMEIDFSGGFIARSNRPVPSPAFRIPLSLSLSTSFDPSITLISFPLEPGNVWGINSTEITIDGKLQTIYLRFIHIIHNIARILQLIPEELMDLSDIIHRLLPIIDFSDAMYEFMGVNTLPIYEKPYIQGCIGMEEITVEAGTFNCYNITHLDGVYNLYYSPEIGNIVKMTGNIHTLFSSVKPITLTLISMDIPKN